jgi:UDP-N-acetylglucosamine acyltransferase
MTNNISASATIIGDVQMGSGNFISNGVTIIGPATIGNNNYFGPNSVVGTPPQDDHFPFTDLINATLGLESTAVGIRIGNSNVIREFVTIHKGLSSPTIVEDNCYFMSYAHIAHDCKIFSGVKIANNVQMGGYTSLLQGAYIGLSAVIHQFTVVGQFSMVGMGSVTKTNVPPGALTFGAPSKMIKVNKIALERLGIADFSWEQGYVADPSVQTVHNDLKLYFQEFSDEKNLRAAQRLELSSIRDLK